LVRYVLVVDTGGVDSEGYDIIQVRTIKSSLTIIMASSRSITTTQALLIANLLVMSFIAYQFITTASRCIQPPIIEDVAIAPPSIPIHETATAKKNYTTTSVAGIGSTNSAGFYFVHPKEGELDFYKIGKTTSTDKIQVCFLLYIYFTYFYNTYVLICIQTNTNQNTRPLIDYQVV